MPTARKLWSVMGVGALSAALAAAPTTAHAQVPVLCSETALVNAINGANANGGDTLLLTPGCTYTLTSAHGSASDGPVGLPPITTPITMLGMGTNITRAPSASAFRILEVDGTANVPGTKGQLNMTGITISGGNAVAPFPGGGIADRGGAVSLTAGSVTGNTAIAGGGIYVDNGSVTLMTSSVTGNTATNSGGGIYVNSGAVNLLVSKVNGNTPDNCAPPDSVPGCSG
ncbi:hypothetical protein [Streptomyces silvisoli]|uniref:Right-handed parallel beta-helix repeat-containing protein n=1 Tax=Streptomyces silvisoli TaxID=3034235 RepID=A0ABT5ZSQ6_9ACTN|nr:hypothetical protein [Streptomyces silvisoli]MDF3292686.1 hypothetical protein [Streptomyces silvisoli]